MHSKDKTELSKLANQYVNSPINRGSDQSYYCSELVEYILETIDENFRILPIKKKLVKFDQFYLQRDSIEYYPVDIFMNNKNFVHIKSK